MIAAIRAEWIKLSTVTVTWVLAILAIAFPLVITILTAALGEDLDRTAVADVLAGTTIVSALLLGVVASLSITGEFGHGTIRPTFAALPDRWRALLAKPIVQVSLTVVVVALVVVVGYAVGDALVDSPSTLDDGAGAALVGVLVLAVGLTLLGLGLGMLIRNSAATICGLLLWPLIAENLLAGLLTVVGAEGGVKFLPYVAGLNMAIRDTPDDSLGRVGGGVYFMAWVVVLFVAGLLRTHRRDA